MQNGQQIEQNKKKGGRKVVSNIHPCDRVNYWLKEARAASFEQTLVAVRGEDAIAEKDYGQWEGKYKTKQSYQIDIDDIDIYTPTILLNTMKESVCSVTTVHTRQTRASARQPGSSDDQAGI